MTNMPTFEKVITKYSIEYTVRYIIDYLVTEFTELVWEADLIGFGAKMRGEDEFSCRSVTREKKTLVKGLEHELAMLRGLGWRCPYNRIEVGDYRLEKMISNLETFEKTFTIPRYFGGKEDTFQKVRIFRKDKSGYRNEYFDVAPYRFVKLPYEKSYCKSSWEYYYSMLPDFIKEDALEECRIYTKWADLGKVFLDYDELLEKEFSESKWAEDYQIEDNREKKKEKEVHVQAQHENKSSGHNPFADFFK